jgi:hypothetical protein
VSGIRTGKADVEPSKPSHTEGVRQGNEPGSYDKQVGHHGDGRSDARRSTGVNPKSRNPIDPAMPNLSPA